MDTSEAHDACNTASPRPVTQTQTQTQEDTTTPADPPTPSTSTAPAAVGTLRLRGVGTNSTRVQWDEEVVDNEFMGRKKSKICCIYHRPKASFDESSGSESDSSCGSTDSRAARPVHSHHEHHPAGPEPRQRDESRAASSETPHGGEGATRPAPNAYEKASGGGKGKARDW